MATFLTTNAIALQIEEVLRTAQNRIWLVSPYLQISKILFERLRDADSRGVVIFIVYGKDEMATEEREKISALDKVKLYFLNNLHAKCFLNESIAVIGSMNIYEFSEKNNREMGVLIRKDEDPDAFRLAVDEIASIIRASRPIDVRKEHGEPANSKSDGNGHCIRCGQWIPFDRERPFCRPCYQIWAEYGNYEYPEGVCHACGRPDDVSMAYPLCERCFGQWVRGSS